LNRQAAKSAKKRKGWTTPQAIDEIAIAIVGAVTTMTSERSRNERERHRRSSAMPI
jgi:hypothetical protein